jgi:hypothetical protein
MKERHWFSSQRRQRPNSTAPALARGPWITIMSWQMTSYHARGRDQMRDKKSKWDRVRTDSILPLAPPLKVSTFNTSSHHHSWDQAPNTLGANHMHILTAGKFYHPFNTLFCSTSAVLCPCRALLSDPYAAEPHKSLNSVAERWLLSSKFP